MGLAEFVKIVIRQLFPDVFSFTAPTGGIDNLAIDANGTLHDARSYFEEYKIAIENQSTDSILIGYFRRFEDEILDIVRSCGPGNRSNLNLMIAIDGVAPRAKLLQQRMRRHSSVSSDIFDPNAISPYTWFMSNIHGKILDMLNNETIRARYPKTIIYSSYQVPGEGEQKIFMKLANNSLDSNRPTVIAGLDSDLILMGIMSSAKKLYLMRKSGRGPNKRQIFLDVSSLRHGIIANLGGESGARDKVLDFSVLTLIFGNDFSPPIPGLTYYTEFSTVLNVYKTKNINLIDGDEVSLSGLLQLMEGLPAQELLANHVKETKLRLKRDAELPVPKLRNSYLANLELEGYRDGYYAYVDPNPKTVKQTILNMCINWVQMLNWTYSYFRFYAKSVSSVDAYEYNLAPMLPDLVEVLRVMINIPPSITPGTIHPYAALIMILPRTSTSVVPEELRFIINRLPPYQYLIDEYLSSRNILIAPWLDYQYYNRLVSHIQVTEGVEITNTVQSRKNFNYRTNYKVMTGYTSGKLKEIKKAQENTSPVKDTDKVQKLSTKLRYVKFLNI
jgi:5'-3' exonuclease